MTKSRSNLLSACLLVAAGVWFVQSKSAPAVPDSPAPDAALQVAVSPVKAIKVDSVDGRRLAGFYSALADVVSRDTETISTMKALREVNARAGALCFQQTGIAGKYPGLADAIDKVLAARLGLDNVALDAAKRAEAVATLKALAWAFGG
jgi:hypothetical protein